MHTWLKKMSLHGFQMIKKVALLNGYEHQYQVETSRLVTPFSSVFEP